MLLASLVVADPLLALGRCAVVAAAVGGVLALVTSAAAMDEEEHAGDERSGEQEDAGARSQR